jgi:hypothetical protein
LSAWFVSFAHRQRGQADDELRSPSPALPACLDLSLVQLDQSPYHGQADAESSLSVVEPGVALREEVEDPGQHLCRLPIPLSRTRSIALSPRCSISTSIRPPGGVSGFPVRTVVPSRAGH